MQIVTESMTMALAGSSSVPSPESQSEKRKAPPSPHLPLADTIHLPALTHPPSLAFRTTEETSEPVLVTSPFRKKRSIALEDTVGSSKEDEQDANIAGQWKMAPSEQAQWMSSTHHSPSGSEPAPNIHTEHVSENRVAQFSYEKDHNVENLNWQRAMGPSWKDFLPEDENSGQGLVREAGSPSMLVPGSSDIRCVGLLRELTPLPSKGKPAKLLPKPAKREEQPGSIIDCQGTGAAPSEEEQPRWKSGWNTLELLVLIAAKRSEFERSSIAPLDVVMKTADNRWKAVGKFCTGKGVKRTASQCRSRWEKILTDFNKVHYYQKNIQNDYLGYFEMSVNERKRRKLPLNFKHECYESMEVWVPAHRAVNPDPEKMGCPTGYKSQLDTGVDPSAHASLQIVNVNVSNISERSTPEAAFGRLSEAGSLHKEEPKDEQLPTEDMPHSNMTESIPRIRKGQGLKCKSQDKNDDLLLRMIENFMNTFAQETAKRNLQEADFMLLEERRLALEERKHCEQLAQAQEIASEIIAALKEVSAGLRNFGEMMSRTD